MFQHDTIEKSRRELGRNGQLRDMCGFEGQVPTSSAYTRFLKTFMDHEELVDQLFERLVQGITHLLPDFGKHLAMDSKAIPSFAKHEGHRDEVPRPTIFYN
nr:transposase [Mesobacillus subterraneus]